MLKYAWLVSSNLLSTSLIVFRCLPLKRQSLPNMMYGNISVSLKALKIAIENLMRYFSFQKVCAGDTGWSIHETDFPWFPVESGHSVFCGLSWSDKTLWQKTHADFSGFSNCHVNGNCYSNIFYCICVAAQVSDTDVLKPWHERSELSAYPETRVFLCYG